MCLFPSWHTRYKHCVLVKNKEITRCLHTSQDLKPVAVLWPILTMILLAASENDRQNVANRAFINWLLNLKCPTFEIEFNR